MPNVQGFFDPATFTCTYVVTDPRTRDGILIDPVLDFDPASGKVDTQSLDNVAQWIRKNEIKVHWILETHAHADHLSGAATLVRKHLPQARIGMGRHITEVQDVFARVFNLGQDFPCDGRQFDGLFGHGETVKAGSLECRVLETPGHTPACVSYLVADCVFTGDALFMPDFGTGRCDFPKGDARTLYQSVTRHLYSLPDATRVFVGHDYQPGGRPIAYETTIGESKRSNIQLAATTTEEAFVKFRTERDRTLSAPRLLLPSIQFNIAAGEWPKPESNGTSYLKLPLTLARPL